MLNKSYKKNVMISLGKNLTSFKKQYGVILIPEHNDSIDKY